MGSPLKRLPGIWEILARATTKFYSLQLFSDGPRGASDHKKDFRNENFRRFAIGAVYHFSFWDALGEKLGLFKVRKADY